jgi:hypothetical protein
LTLIIRKQEGKEYFYYLMKGSRRLYLWTPEKPKIERIYEAMNFLRSQIREQEEELRKLEMFCSKN